MKISNLKFQILGIILFVTFVILTIAISLGVFVQTDYASTIFLQNNLPDFLTTPFSVFSILGSAEIASLFLLILFLSISILRKLFVLFLYGLTGAIEIVEKSLISQSGPPIEFLKTNIHFGFPSGSISADFFSYPSGHMARTAFISGVLLFAIWKSRLGKELKYGLVFCILTFDFIMFVSRVYLGEHWLSDVVGGALLGFSLAILTYYFFGVMKWRTKTSLL